MSSNPRTTSSVTSTQPETQVAAAAQDRPAADEVAEVQQESKAWPKPGDEGYVHPDGTAQSVQQLEANRQAAADRAAKGSIVHGIPHGVPATEDRFDLPAEQRLANVDEYPAEVEGDTSK